MTRWHIDLETYAVTDLRESGAARYGEDPTLEVLCMAAYAPASGRVLRWRQGLPYPAMIRPGDTLAGWNVQGFDRLVWDAYLVPVCGFPPSDQFTWDDTMIRAAATNLPLKLALVGKALGLDDSDMKDSAGHSLMKTLCRPANETTTNNDPKRRHTPENLARLEDYCVQDTYAEAAVAARLPPLIPHVREEEALDRAINRRGLLVDSGLVSDLATVAAMHRQQLREGLSRVTGGAVETENKRKALAAWLQERGVPPPVGSKTGTDKAAVEAYLRDQYGPPEVAVVMGIMHTLARTSLAKLEAIQRSICADGRMRGTLQFLAAQQTGRWGGRLVQWQNVPRGVLGGEEEYRQAIAAVRACVRSGSMRPLDVLYGGDESGAGDVILDVLASLIRACVVPPPGKVLLDADYNAIEPRVVAWLAGCEKTLGMYRDGIDLYIADAAVALGIPRSQVKKYQRNQLGKPCRIGFAYGLGGRKFSEYATAFGANLNTDEGVRIIKAMRTEYPAIPAFWKALDKAAIQAIENPGRRYHAGKHVSFHFIEGNLTMRLPSGRDLWYRDATVELKPAPWDPGTMLKAVAYSYPAEGQWKRDTTWGGTFTEQATQAVSRDLLAHALMECERTDLPVVLHVHDQILAEVPAGTSPDRLTEAMCQLPEWAAGLPVKADAFVRDFWVK